MAIEPLGSVMSAQLQTARVAEPKVTVENMDVKTPQAEVQVDNSTVAVAKVEGKAEQYNSENKEQANSDKLKKAVDTLNKQMSNAEAVFGIHEDTNRVTIKLVDKETKEVIKELPPEKTLDMIAKAWELAGLLVDEKR